MGFFYAKRLCKSTSSSYQQLRAHPNRAPRFPIKFCMKEALLHAAFQVKTTAKSINASVVVGTDCRRPLHSAVFYLVRTVCRKLLSFKNILEKSLLVEQCKNPMSNTLITGCMGLSPSERSLKLSNLFHSAPCREERSVIAKIDIDLFILRLCIFVFSIAMFLYREALYASISHLGSSTLLSKVI